MAIKNPSALGFFDEEKYPYFLLYTSGFICLDIFVCVRIIKEHISSYLV